MKVSVIIPVYNDADVLPRALASVMRQTLKPHEVIIVDDGSDPDNRKAIFKALYLDLDPDYSNVNYDLKRHRVRLDQNGGPFVAMNAGVKASTGDAVEEEEILLANPL